jgi:hypothetical protein
MSDIPVSYSRGYEGNNESVINKAGQGRDGRNENSDINAA